MELVDNDTVEQEPTDEIQPVDSSPRAGFTVLVFFLNVVFIAAIITWLIQSMGRIPPPV